VFVLISKVLEIVIAEEASANAFESSVAIASRERFVANSTSTL
jgi:hypothetical protein